MAEKLTKEIVYKALQGFFAKKPMVLFGTGMSCALDKKFGMVALKEHLISNMPKSLIDEQQKQWQRVVESLKNNDSLEAAMDNVKDEELVRVIINLTADLLMALDKEYSVKILNDEVEWIALDLFKRMVDRLPETDRILHVATPNYDLLAEYAFEKNQIPYITGYVGGICRNLDWPKSEMGVKYFRVVAQTTCDGVLRI